MHVWRQFFVRRKTTWIAAAILVLALTATIASSMGGARSGVPEGAGIIDSASSAEDLPFVTDEALLGLPVQVTGAAAPADGDVELQAALGRDLFFDTRLSADSTVSCSSCHLPDHGYADPVPLSTGIGGQQTLRNTPSLLNRAYGKRFMWDLRFDSLEEQVLEPIRNPAEMGDSVDAALARIDADEGYRARFADAFGDGVSDRNLARALAAFVRRLRIGDSPIDRFQAARGILTAEERAGLWIYESKGRCWKCHSGPNFSDELAHNTGVGAVDGVARPGQAAITGRDADRGKFKTPTLRGLAFTAPYMHDGSLATLEDVVEFYRRGGNANRHLDPALAPIDLSDADARHLVAFLKALSRSAQ